MTDNQKFLAGVIIGAAAGVAASLFLSSDKGKEIMGDVKDFAGNVGSNVKEKASSIVEKGKQFVQDFNRKPAADEATVDAM